MTKKIFLILAVAGMSCSLHMKAAVPPVTKDTVQLESYTTSLFVGSVRCV